jgi:hypothetical protein
MPVSLIETSSAAPALYRPKRTMAPGSGAIVRSGQKPEFVSRRANSKAHAGLRASPPVSLGKDLGKWGETANLRRGEATAPICLFSEHQHPVCRPEIPVLRSNSKERLVNVPLAVNGTLMRGLSLNGNLLSVGATFDRDAATVASYRLWSIDDRHPAMVRVSQGGAAIAVEVWQVPAAGLATILLGEPPGLAIGKVRLEDGQETLGVLGEPALCDGQREITAYGGWRAYLAARATRAR